MTSPNPMMVVLCILALASPVSAVVSREDLASRLEAFNTLQDYDFDTEFELHILPSRPAGDDSPWVMESWEYYETFRYVALGDKLYVSRRSHERPDEPPAHYHQENVWADGVWYHRIEGDPGIGLYSQASPCDLHAIGFKFNLMQGRFPSYRTLADVVRTGYVVSQRMEDGVLVHRFIVDGKNRSRGQQEIRVRLEPRFELISHTSDFSDHEDPAEFADHVYLRVTRTILEWREVDGLRIPWRAMVETEGRRDRKTGADTPRVRRAYYTRESWKAADPSDPKLQRLMEVPLSQGVRIYDDRVHASYAIGQTYLYIDGETRRLNEPVQGIIHDYPAVLRDSPTMQEPTGERALAGVRESAMSRSTQADPDYSPLRIAIFVGSAVALFTWSVMRMFRYRRTPEG